MARIAPLDHAALTARAYWFDRLARVNDRALTPALPSDRSPLVDVEFTWSAHTAAAIRALAHDEPRISSTLLAAVATWLFRRLMFSQVILWTPSTDTTANATRSLVPIALSMHPAAAFSELIDETCTAAVDATRYQSAVAPWAGSTLRLPDDREIHASTAFVVMPDEIDHVIALPPGPALVARYRRTHDGGFAGTFRGAPVLVESMSRQLETLLRDAVVTNAPRLADLRLVDDPRDAMLVGEPSEPRVRAENRTEALVRKRAAATPDHVAIVDGERHVTYGELVRRARQLAQRLRTIAKVLPEQAIAVLVPPSIEWVIAILGAWEAGACAVVVDLGVPDERLRAMIEESGARVAIVTGVADSSRRWRDDQSLIEVDVYAGGDDAENDERRLDGALAYVVFTSGSTGRPKGVAIEHHGLVDLCAWHNRAYGVDGATRASQVASTGFDASIWETWPYLTGGATLCIAPAEARTSPAAVATWLGDEAMTHAFLATPLAEAVLQRYSLPRLAYLLTGGDRLHHVDASRAGRFLLVNHYGPTENTVVSTAMPVPASGGPADPPIGLPIQGVRTYLLDDHLQLAPRGSDGELYIAGAALARGYVNAPELTAERFLPDPFAPAPGARMYRTGDICRLNDDGALQFVGRRDHQIKLRGHRIELEEIESTLRRHPNVIDVIASIQPVRGRPMLTAHAVLSGNAPADAVRSFAAAKLPEYMVPLVVPVDHLPRLPNGKLDRRAPRPPAIVASSSARPRSPSEHALFDVWCAVLGVSDVATDVNFFDAGGDSLLLAELQLRVQERFGREIQMTDLLKHSTIAALAAHLDGRAMNASSDALSADVDRGRDANFAARRERMRERGA